MDIVIEVVLEIYMELMLLIAPEKGVTKAKRILAKVLAIAVILLNLALFVWGINLIWEVNNFLGIIPFSFAIIISVAQIVLGILFFKKNH